ncbi:MAG: glucoamylase family protein [Bacteroidota bacterium]|nr:glucoamylase family protein [Bacteroidota bacterium]
MKKSNNTRKDHSNLYPLPGLKVFILVFLIFLTSCKGKEVPTIVVIKNDDTYTPAKVEPVLDEWQHKTFNYFYGGASPTGMILEGNGRGDGGIVTTGGSGFGLMAIIVGSERGWITREQAAERTQKMLRFLGKAERFQGMWSHWYTPDGASYPFEDQVKTGDIVESAFMAAGFLTAAEYYTGNSAIETEIRDSVSSFWNSMNWRFYAGSDKVLHWLWYSQGNRLAMDVRGWNEAWIVYILALGAPGTHNISTDIYTQGWLSNGTVYHTNSSYYGYNLPLGDMKGGPLFFAHYSFLGLDPRKIEDQQVNYWKQNVAHTMVNRHYCLEEAPVSYKYDEKNWGLTACYGAKPPLWNYLARSPSSDDGVIAPTAALGSFPYTPFYSIQVLLQLAGNSLAQGTYGFADSYCPSTNTSEKRHLAIDQGPIVVMMENYRSGLIWNLLMKNEHVKAGLLLAGVKDKPTFSQGFHRAVINTKTNEYDMIRHPDRGKYELDFFLNTAGNTKFSITNSDNKIILDTIVNASSGENLFSFDSKSILNGKQYTISMNAPDGKEHQLVVRLR